MWSKPGISAFKSSVLLAAAINIATLLFPIIADGGNVGGAAALLTGVLLLNLLPYAILFRLAATEGELEWRWAVCSLALYASCDIAVRVFVYKTGNQSEGVSALLLFFFRWRERRPYLFWQFCPRGSGDLSRSLRIASRFLPSECAPARMIAERHLLLRSLVTPGQITLGHWRLRRER